MAYYGNLALRPERVEEQKVLRNTRSSESYNRVVRRRSIPIGEKLLYLFTVAVVATIAGLIVFRYAQIYQINSQVQAKNKAYEQAVEQSKELKKEVERLSDPERIVDFAKGLGFVPISEKEITAVSIDDKNALAMKP